MGAKRVPTIEKVLGLIKVARVFSGTTEKTNCIVWTGSATTTSGVATFYLTEDGTPTGTALFANIFSIQGTAELDTTDPEEVALASVKTISGDRKILKTNIVSGSDPKTTFVPNNTRVWVTVIGD